MNRAAEKCQNPQRQLRDLAGVGARVEENLRRLGIQDVAQLSGQNGDELYRRLGEVEGARPDPCVLDTFRCAVAQARNPLLPQEQQNWWWWSRERKAGRIPDLNR